MYQIGISTRRDGGAWPVWSPYDVEESSYSITSIVFDEYFPGNSVRPSGDKSNSRGNAPAGIVPITVRQHAPFYINDTDDLGGTSYQKSGACSLRFFLRNRRALSNRLLGRFGFRLLRFNLG